MTTEQLIESLRSHQLAVREYLTERGWTEAERFAAHEVWLSYWEKLPDFTKTPEHVALARQLTDDESASAIE